MKYWEIIADNLSKAGWSWGCSSEIDSTRRVLFTADAYFSDGRRFIVLSDDKLSAFLELELANRRLRRIFLTTRFFSDLMFSTDSNLAEDCLLPARFFVSSGPATTKNNQRGKERKNP